MTLVSTRPGVDLRAAHGSRSPVVRAHGLTKEYVVRRRLSQMLRSPTRMPALCDVSIEAFEGEIVGLLGPNGAGKTTFLKILSSLILADAGTVEIAGYDVVREPAAARRVLAPVTADERSLDWRLTARENLRFFGTLHGLRGEHLHARIEDLLRSVELADTGEKLVAAFSSGMRQRLLIARGLLSRPRVLLLDEPTRSLDPLGARAFREFIRSEIAGRHGCTIVLATHDPAEALELCDRIGILDRGRLLAMGTPSQLTREFGDERYRVWCREVDHAEFSALRAEGMPIWISEELDPDGAGMLELELSSLPGGPARVLARLVSAGVQVTRFEKVMPTVADLMERVVRTRRIKPDA